MTMGMRRMFVKGHTITKLAILAVIGHHGNAFPTLKAISLIPRKTREKDKTTNKQARKLRKHPMH